MAESPRILYLDLVGGVAGDMLLAALLDAGAPLGPVEAAIAAMGLTGVELRLSEAHPAGLRARRVDVLIHGRLGDARPGRGDRGAVGEASSGGEEPASSFTHDRSELARANAPEPPGGAHLHVLGPAREAAVHLHEAHEHSGHAHGQEHTHAHPHSHEPGLHGSAPRPTGRMFRAAHALPFARSKLDHPTHAEVHHHRPYRVIRELIEDATGLPERVRTLALSAFEKLALAEGLVHGVDPEEVELHEVGSDDAIADIVGVAAALVSLGVDEVIASPVPLGRGLITGAHGPIPLPGPATLELLRGVPVEGTELKGETVTPTGAALLKAIVTRFGRAPAMTLEAVGIGAGHRAWPDRPNIVRALLGRATSAHVLESSEECVVEANIDDMSPEHLAALKRALYAAGAIDVWSAPIAMKKDRLGVQVSALARRTLSQVIASAFFTHSTTLGVRLAEVARIRGERRMEEVETPYGRVRVKIAERPSGPPLVAPEYDDLERLAEASGVSIRAVSEAALKAVWANEPST